MYSSGSEFLARSRNFRPLLLPVIPKAGAKQLKGSKLISHRFTQRIKCARLTMLRPQRSYGEDEGDYNGIALPTPKRRKICTGEEAGLDNQNGADELSIENPISTGKSLPESDETTYDYRASIHPSFCSQSINNGIRGRCSPAQATEVGDVVESSGNSQKICFGMVSYYR